MTVINMNSHREPVIYSIHVTHHWGGEVEVEVEGLTDNGRSHRAAAEALREAAAVLEARAAA